MPFSLSPFAEASSSSQFCISFCCFWGVLLFINLSYVRIPLLALLPFLLLPFFSLVPDLTYPQVRLEFVPFFLPSLLVPFDGLVSSLDSKAVPHSRRGRFEQLARNSTALCVTRLLSASVLPSFRCRPNAVPRAFLNRSLLSHADRASFPRFDHLPPKKDHLRTLLGPKNQEKEKTRKTDTTKSRNLFVVQLGLYMVASIVLEPPFL